MRLVVIASNASATAMIRDRRGIASPLEAGGITATVMAFVMMTHDFRQFAVHLDARQGFVTDFDMLLDQIILQAGQAARLEQDGIGNGDLADVMQNRRPIQTFDIFPAIAQMRWRSARNISTRAGMTGGIGIALFDHFHHRQDGVFIVADALQLQSHGFGLMPI
jgi:hypothetical protein